MAIPQNKKELLAAIEVSFSKLEKDFSTLSSAHVEIASMEGHRKGSLMSPKNLLAYLIGWGTLVLKWEQKIKLGETVDWPEKGFNWTELGELAQKFYADYESLSFEESMEKLKQTKDEIVALISSCSNEDLYETTWYKSYSMGRMIQLNTASPYKNARTRIRKWKKVNKL